MLLQSFWNVHEKSIKNRLLFDKRHHIIWLARDICNIIHKSDLGAAAAAEENARFSEEEKKLIGYPFFS